MCLPVFLVGVLLPAHPGAHAPHELLLELGVDQLPCEGVAVARARRHLGAVLAAGELGGVLGAAQLVLARVLHVVGPEVRLGRPSQSRIAYFDFIFVTLDLFLFTKGPVTYVNRVTRGLN